MIKLVCFLKAKQGLSVSQMREHYENNHVPLISRLLPAFADYRRNYVMTEQLAAPGSDNVLPAERDFDVMTEVFFSCIAAYRKNVDACSDPQIWQQIVEDEEKFLDRSATVMYVMEEVQTCSAEMTRMHAESPRLKSPGTDR